MSQRNGTKLAERFATIRKMIEDNRENIFASAAGGVDPDYYIGCFLRQISKNPQLAECTNQSLVNSLADSAAYGLPFNSLEGDAYLVPRRRSVKDGSEWRQLWEAQFQAGYLGKLKLAYESPLVAAITVEAVRDGDVYKARLGSVQEIIHEPADSRGALTHIYGVLWLSSGGRRCVSWTIDEIQEHAATYVEQKSLKSDKGAWKTSFRRMAAKVVLSDLLKYAPTSARTRRLLQSEEYADAGVQAATSGLRSGDTMSGEDLDRLADDAPFDGSDGDQSARDYGDPDEGLFGEPTEEEQRAAGLKN